MKYDYLVLDFNGTIIDDVDLCLNILNHLLEERNYKKVSLEEYKHIFTFPIKKYYINAGFNLEKYSFTSISSEFISLYQKASLNCKLYEGINELIDKCNNNEVKVVLLSASQIDNLKEQTDHFGLSEKFEAILGTSTIEAASKVEIGKNYFKDKQDKKILFVGDTTHDAEVASAIGADALLITHGHQARDILLKANPLKVVDSFKEVEDILGI
ncbi:MAG: HAD hydrolase-like protein [Bacillales bacterium]|nr:HAD hydrolase-like protein [Bacillales bacterium]